MVIYSFNFSTLLSDFLGISFEEVPELSDQNINLMPDDYGKLKGYKMPIEFGIAISEACKGRTANNKGKPNPAQRERFITNNPMFNIESREKMRLSKIGKRSHNYIQDTRTFSCDTCSKENVVRNVKCGKTRRFCDRSCQATFTNTNRRGFKLSQISQPPAAEQANS